MVSPSSVASRPFGSTGTTSFALFLLTTCVTPFLFVGSHGPSLRAEFGWSLSSVGLSISVFFLVSAVSAIPAGMLVERFGVSATARIAVTGSALVLLSVALLPGNAPWWALTLLLGAAGVFLALGQTTSSALLAYGVRPVRQGVAFGIRQVAIPFATLIAGGTVVFVDRGSWRAAFVLGVLPGAVMLAYLQCRRDRLPSGDPDARAGREHRSPARVAGLRVLGLAAAAAGSAGAAIGAFYVEALRATGFTAAQAGAWLIVGSVVGILARPAWGLLADRLTDHARLLAWLMGLGALGVVALGVQTSTPVLAVGTMLAFACGWGWTGTLNLVAVRSSPTAPAAASGLVSTGNFVGSAIGPVVFAALASRHSYRVAWLACGVLLGVGVVLAGVSRRMLRAVGSPEPAPTHPPDPRVECRPEGADMTWSIWLEHLRTGQVRYLSAGGVRTRCLEAGDENAPAVVFLHGTGGHAEAFVRNLEPFAEAGYRAVAIDMLGHGLTDKPTGCGYDLDDYARHLLALMDQLGPRPVHLVGESLGGGVAMRAAILAPHRVATVVTVVGGGLGPVPATPEEERGWSRMLELSEKAYDAMDHAAWTARMQWLVHDPADMPDEMIRTRMVIYDNPRMREAAADIYRGVANMVYRKRPGMLLPGDLRSFPVPVFYYWTDHNPTTPARVAAAAHELTPVSEYDVLDGCGHWPQFEKPDAFNARVLRFLRGHPADGAAPVTQASGAASC
ncbi:MFS transporter [Micromonospora inositola]|uniref:Pimeloyl-ACP methyl ester carboxylesterase n=1 Tax=Micromonospora inositola TaxID=47865 RepID=A0A1C5K572_9ACTN|nr:MFS transporter [Micromonospora inositola]SCG77938.1 Pimeloyl-ACP methyl ester carboxylesterase [Micromonospora inositola]